MAKYDPAIGIMHERRDGSPAFIFDMMEPERPAVDRMVLEFVKRSVFDPTDFVIRSDGVCRPIRMRDGCYRKQPDGTKTPHVANSGLLPKTAQVA